MIALVARNTYREAVRDRLLAGVTAAGVALLLVIQLATPLAIGEGTRLTTDLGLSAISLFGLLVILLVGTGLVAKEIERRTIYNLLARPLPRSSYLIGKWLGLSAALWAVAALLGLALWVLLVLRGSPGHGPALLQAVYLAGLELTVITALAVLASAVSTPVLSALFTLGFFCVGQWSYDLRGFAETARGALGAALAAAANLAPNLPLFNMRALAAAGETTSVTHLGVATAYAVLYCACVLAAAAALFERRDFR